MELKMIADFNREAVNKDSFERLAKLCAELGIIGVSVEEARRLFLDYAVKKNGIAGQV